MKITDVKTFVVGNPPPGIGGRYFIFVKLVTDGGVVGYGEAYSATFGPHGTARMIEDCAERHLVGHDPHDIEAFFRRAYSSGFSQRPDISILDDRFLADVRGLQHKHVAAEMLAGLLRGEIRKQSERNVVLSQRFSEKLKQALNAYHNHALSAQEIIEQLIALAKELRDEEQRHTELGLAPDETAFYDALAANESAVEVLGNEQLKLIAVELIRSVRSSVTIDWQFKEGARAKIRVTVKKILRRFGYPPDLQDEAVKLVLAQAEVLCDGWTM